MAVLQILGLSKPKRLVFTFGLAIAVVSLLGVTVFGVNRTHAASCGSNNIIGCGFSTRSDFISTVQANNNGVNNVPDLQAIYAHYGLSSADYSSFATHAVAGEAMRNGQIIVNGQVVGTGGMSIGRLESFQGASPFSVAIAGHTYYGNVNAQAFAAGVNEIPVYVLFNASGTFQFAVMPSCGNPEFPSVPVQTSASCQVLNKTAVAGKANTFTFTAAAAKTGNATITKFVYNFGDGSPSVTETSGATPVTHTYTGTGTFTASVTVFASVPGNANLQLPAVSMCAKQVVITPPPTPAPVPKPTPQAVTASCVQLVAVPEDNNSSETTFTFTATAAFSPGVTFTSTDFNFGDGNVQSGVQPNSDGMTATTTHTYTTSNTFTASAVLHFTNTSGQPITAPACTTTASPVIPAAAPPTPPPVTPAVTALPSTGAGDTIGIFFGTVTVGTIGYRMFIRRKLSRH